jgi:methyl-accepting chemotaxis protein
VGVLHNIKIKTRLYALILLVSLLLVGVGATGLSGINASNKALSEVYNEHLLAIEQLNDVRNNQMQIRIALLSARQESDAFEILAYVDKISGLIFRTENILKAYNARTLPPEERRLADEFMKVRQHFGTAGVMPMIDLLQSEKFAEADKLRKNVLDPAYAKASAAIDALVKYQMDSVKSHYDRSIRYARNTLIISSSSIAAGLALTILIGLLITKDITRGVATLEQTASRLADGDLTTRANIRGKNELGQVAWAFNQMTDELAGLIRQLHGAADHVAVASGQLSETAEKVTLSSQNQAGQAENVALSVESLNEAVKKVALNAQNAAGAANKTSELAVRGVEVANEAAAGILKVSETFSQSAKLIDSLGQRSQQIGHIVNVIKEIADQTNLLALNAAIEAARAGEQGRGFAVVADEVRKLAERTSTATTEISDMIQAIQLETRDTVDNMERGGRQVESSVERAKRAGEALASINDSVQQVSRMIQQIALSTKSESEASQEITARVEDIARTAKENGESIYHTASAAHDLQQLSSQLLQAVSRFRL